jgi:hypothetical protein
MRSLGRVSFEQVKQSKAMFIRLIIRHFQLVFLVGTVFFSHNKSVNSIFQPGYQHSRTGPKPYLCFFGPWAASQFAVFV